uniref:Uncharacterized protein n=1 Tax=Mastacembelus armatus TaxID=205130 RepID=A0A3Q3S4E4_9TELE
MALQAIMQTIMIGKMEMVLPDMYMMNRFMGICFRGPRATSQQHIYTQRLFSITEVLQCGTMLHRQNGTS